jgi:WD40 repeat protein
MFNMLEPLPKMGYAQHNRDVPLEMVLQNGHTNNISCITIDPSGKFLISGSIDNSVKILDLESGIILRTLVGHTDLVQSISVDALCRYIVSGSRDNTIKVWDFVSGNLLKTIYLFDNEMLWSVVIDPSAKFIVSSVTIQKNRKPTDDLRIKIFDLASGKLLNSIKGHAFIPAVAIDPSGQFIVSGERNKNNKYEEQGIIKIWELISGRLIKTVKAHDFTVRAIAIDPNGKFIVSAGSYGEKTIKIWNLKSGKLIQRLKGHTGSIEAVIVHPSANFIISRSSDYGNNIDSTIKIWNLRSGRPIRTIVATKGFSPLISIDPTGRFIVSCVSQKEGSSIDTTIKLIDFISGKLLRTINSETHIVMAAAVDPNGHCIVTGNWDGTIKIWDLRTGRLLKNLKGHSGCVGAISINSTGTLVVSGSAESDYFENGEWHSRDKTIKIWDLKSGKLRKTLGGWGGHSNGISDVAIDPNGNYIVSASWDKTVKLWDLKSGSLVRTMMGHSDVVRSVEIDPTGQMIISSSKDKTIKLWDIKSGRLIRTIEGHSGDINSCAVDPSGQFIISSTATGEIKLWCLKSGNLIKTMKGHSGRVHSVGVDLAGQFILSSGEDCTIKLWNLKTGSLIKTFEGHSAVIAAASFTPDGRHIVSGSADGTTRIWNIQTGEHISLISVGYEWMVSTNDGYFDSSRNGSRLVMMVKGLTPFGVDQFAIRNNRPDVILMRIGIGSDELINHYHSQYQKRLRRFGLKEHQIASDYHVPTVKITDTKQNGKFMKLSFNLSDVKYNLIKYNIYINDVPLFGAYGKPIGGNDLDLTETLELTSGKNKIEITCFNETGAESFRGITYAVYQKETKGDLYYVGFGVSRYKDSNLNLQYAHKDVVDLGETFSKMKDRFNHVHTKIYLNEDVTVESIKSAKKFLSSAWVDDTFVLFIAGHGLHDTDRTATYYYLTHNTVLKDLANTAANFDLIEDLMQGIPPRNKLFLMDTCDSGEVDDILQTTYFLTADKRGVKARTHRAIKIKMKSAIGKKKTERTYLYSKDRFIYNDLMRRSGAIVFSSSKGGEFSYESNKIQNGFFTEEIINSLTTNVADKDRNGLISIDELRNYVSKAVPIQTDDKQHPTVDRDNIHNKFSFPLVTK